MKKFILLLQFLTRIPINLSLEVTREDLEESVIYFPLVGAIIGAILASIFYFLSPYCSKSVLAFIIVIFEILLTGGLHLDGVSDTFDGIFSGRSKDKILEIMKDPNVGSFGALSLIIIILGKYILLKELFIDQWYVILVMPIISRFCVVFASYVGVYARDNGLGNLFIGKVNKKKLFISFLIMLPFIIFEHYNIIFLLISIIFTLGIVKNINKKIEGITGDTLGAIVEIIEVIILISYNFYYWSVY